MSSRRCKARRLNRRSSIGVGWHPLHSSLGPPSSRSMRGGRGTVVSGVSIRSSTSCSRGLQPRFIPLTCDDRSASPRNRNSAWPSDRPSRLATHRREDASRRPTAHRSLSGRADHSINAMSHRPLLPAHQGAGRLPVFTSYLRARVTGRCARRRPLGDRVRVDRGRRPEHEHRAVPAISSTGRAKDSRW
jgi:hypothetical protein